MLRRWNVAPAALVVLGMTLFAVAVYVAVVRGGGALIGDIRSPHLGLSVFATAIVALGFEPVRRRLLAVAARLAPGGRAAPYDVLARLAAEAGADPIDEVPARMARLLAEATGAAYAQVLLRIDGRLVPAATWPPGAAGAAVPPDPAEPTDASGGRRVLVVRHADDVLGVLVVREHDRQRLTPLEERLFEGLAGQAGLVLRSVRLRAELAAQLRRRAQRATELQASRERIVAAQDEERRRLERNIHDGSQQHLVALAVNVRLARTLIARTSDRAPAVLAQVATAAEETIDTLSDLSRGIYPRVLFETGLAAALESAVKASAVPVALTVEELGRLPQEVEAALYFCCLEALQNAAKHSRAARVVAAVRRVPDGAELVVCDDGVGFSPDSVGSGSGLVNMRDRADAVGGEVRLTARPGGGTVVAVRIPYARMSTGGG